MCDPFGTKKAATRSAEVAATGARQAADAQYGLTSEGLNYLKPFASSGTDANNLLADIIGTNGPEAQQKALGMYKSSPSANLLQQVRDEMVRGTVGKYASGGLSRSGALTEDLARRTSDLDLGNYGNWENLIKGQGQQGLQASGALSSGYGNLGAIKGSGIAGEANARAAGITNKANANAGLWSGGLNLLANAAGFGMGNDWFGSKGSGDVGMGSWSPTVTRY
jgi:hypothetical protein